MKVLENLKYSSDHEWVKVEGEFAFIGITDFAQDQLGEVLFVEMPEVEDEIEKGSDFGVVESSKVASDLVSPISGEVVQINENLEDAPESINEDPYGSWIVKIKMSDVSELDDLLSATDYEASL
ncbi:glycine cleavage system protein GcvH [Asaccharospora irregularis]|uniref:Glycine cleavage system H protein n=1 Tax=Asaccharospora irregularis DSM 2635 TaxID=1121321 RepID=A0A1M5JCZ1_9FIRM|nr:glycine cleavage system protein GcvH [Asaccharospora irregularis]SHG38444.1 glycine cleavage system H protein [Asaccharospora irregularis DSM 2635]